MMTPDWIALDWGTSRLRVWAMSADGRILASADCDRGMASLEPGEYERVLLDQIAPWLSTESCCPVIACGMLGSKQGWAEVPYRIVPCSPLGTPLAIPVSNPMIEVFVCHGVRQDDPPDLMRGEESQIAGLLAGQPGFEGVACLPGTHSKWARISRGEIRSFQSFLTGELFALLSDQSILRHSISPGAWDQGVFIAAVKASSEAPESVLSLLFSIRADSILNNLSGARARARLSGCLVGAELAGAREYWQQNEVVAIVGEQRLSEIYAEALGASGARTEIFSCDAMTLAGLHSAYLNLKTS